MNENATNPGKGLGTGGFVMSLVSIIGYFIVSLMAAASAMLSGSSSMLLIWAVISAIALLLSFMGYRKSAAVSAKKGLATAGIVISLIAVILSAYSHFTINSAMTDPSLQKVRDEMKDSINKGMDGVREDIQQEQDSMDSH